VVRAYLEQVWGDAATRLRMFAENTGERGEVNNPRGAGIRAEGARVDGSRAEGSRASRARPRSTRAGGVRAEASTTARRPRSD
jgi:hypothetical protein